MGTQKLGSLGLPFSVLLLLPPAERWPLELSLAEEELAVLELVVASLATLLILGATERALSWEEGGVTQWELKID